MNLELQASLVYYPGLEPDHREAVRMMCSFYELYPKIFQENNAPYKLPSANKDPRRLYLFKCCLQAIKELKEKNGPDPRVWMIAQLKILRIMDSDKGVYRGRIGSTLYGEKAWIRWKLFESHAKKQASRVAVAAPIKIKPLIESIESTHKLIPESDLESMLLDGRIRMLVRNGKISRVYAALHPKIVEFAKKHTWAAIGIDPITVSGLDNKEVIEAFERITGYKPNGPSIK